MWAEEQRDGLIRSGSKTAAPGRARRNRRHSAHFFRQKGCIASCKAVVFIFFLLISQKCNNSNTDFSKRQRKVCVEEPHVSDSFSGNTEMKKKKKDSHRKAQTEPIWSPSQAEVMHTPRQGRSHSECRGEREVWVWQRNKRRGDAWTPARRLSAGEPRSYRGTTREQNLNGEKKRRNKTNDRQKERKKKNEKGSRKRRSAESENTRCVGWKAGRAEAELGLRWEGCVWWEGYLCSPIFLWPHLWI